jgi:UDP-2-acetamido-3-amino-2,3-dideoxy-glucuronate N-acetyltransferase
VPLGSEEPLRAECQHFLDCINTRAEPLTDGREGLRVLSVLDACQRSLVQGAVIDARASAAAQSEPTYFAHESAFVDSGATVGAGTRIWHFSHVMRGARIGMHCVVGQNVNVDGGTVIGNNVKVQNNVSIYTGAVIEDDVFLGPSCVLTNVSNPRSQINRHALYEATTLRRGCTIGANATIVCGVAIGRYAFIGAGTVVTRDVPDYALVLGNPGRQVGWMSRHGHRLEPSSDGVMTCPESGYRYREASPRVLRCLDLDEEAPLPAESSKGTISRAQLARRTPGQP